MSLGLEIRERRLRERIMSERTGKRYCNHCLKPMFTSWHTETTHGELQVFVHVKCVDDWNKTERKHE